MSRLLSRAKQYTELCTVRKVTLPESYLNLSFCNVDLGGEGSKAEHVVIFHQEEYLNSFPQDERNFVKQITTSKVQ